MNQADPPSSPAATSSPSPPPSSSPGTFPALRSRATTRLSVVAASYGPAVGRRLPDGRVVDPIRRPETYVPHLRNAAPFLRALAGPHLDEDREGEGGEDGGGGDFAFPSPTYAHGSNASFAPMDGRTMNAAFGDPCPGVTKLLTVEYRFVDEHHACADDGGGGGGDEGRGCDLRRRRRRGRSDGSRDGGDDGDNDNDGRAPHDNLQDDGRSSRRRRCHRSVSRVYRSTFREHERVLLRRQDPPFRPVVETDVDPEQDGEDGEVAEDGVEDMEEEVAEDVPNMIPTPQSSTSSFPPISEAPADAMHAEAHTRAHTQTHTQTQQGRPTATKSLSPSKRWKLTPHASSIALPIVLPFLSVRERAKCQLVCGPWRDVVLERGVASTVDVHDEGLFPELPMSSTAYGSGNRGSGTGSRGNGSNGGGSSMGRVRTWSIARSASAARLYGGAGGGAGGGDGGGAPPPAEHPHRPLLRGLLGHSRPSLEALVLGDRFPLDPVADLHPFLPYLRKLKRLDVSRASSVTDETLRLVASCIGPRLEVLYAKGLRNVTDAGVERLIRSCRNLRVLDLSRIHRLTDATGTAIGECLGDLEVLHFQDNYKLTNRSADAIARNCRKLTQATFWGTVALTRVRFGAGPERCGTADGGAASSRDASTPVAEPRALPDDRTRPPTNLVLLNLWGCHGLSDDAASGLASLTRLRSLCVSECHRLTDRFVVEISRSLRGMLHLQLRYVRRITDASLEAISGGMPGLHSLDVGFCAKLTVAGVTSLLIERSDTLAELRLYACRQLDVEGGSLANNGVPGGRELVRAAARSSASALSFLDLRECQQREPFVRDEVFLEGMAGLGFNEALRGLFVRPARGADGAAARRLRASLGDAEGEGPRL